MITERTVCVSHYSVCMCDGSMCGVWWNVEGGIGEAVCSALSLVRDVVVKHLAVTRVPRSGKPEELMSMFGIDAASIVSAVKEVLKL